MDIKEIFLTPLESKILRNAGNISVTKKRIAFVIFFAIILSLLLVVASYTILSFKTLIIGALVYIWLNCLEKVFYGKVIISYKNLVSKLVKALEKNEKDSSVS